MVEDGKIKDLWLQRAERKEGSKGVGVDEG